MTVDFSFIEGAERVEEFLRHAFYQCLHRPFLTNTNGNARADVLKLARAVAALRDRIPGLELRIYGDGPGRAGVQALAQELDVASQVFFSQGWVPLNELLPRITEADAGVVAIRRDGCFDLTHSNKMYDLIALRKPIVMSRTRAVEAYFDDDCFQLFESGSEHDLARAIYELYAHPDIGRRIVAKAARVGEPYRWVHQAKKYLAVMEGLVPAAARESMRTQGVEHI